MGYPICVVCKVNLENPEYHTFICPSCKRRYYLDYEVLSYTEEVGTAYDDSQVELEGIGAGGPGLSTASDRELDFKTPEEEAEERHNKGKIKIPHYMKDSAVSTVEHFHEE